MTGSTGSATCSVSLRPAREVPGVEPARPADTSFTLNVEPDGSFRIDDVRAGTYELIIEVNKKPTEQGGPGNEALATTRHQVVVPEMPGGRSDDPLDLGGIPLTTIQQPAQPAAAPRS